MRVLSVNVGHPQLNPWKTMKLTGIDKRPVDGPVKVTRPPPRAWAWSGWLATGSTTCGTTAARTRRCMPTPGRTSTSGRPNSAGLLPNGVFGENLTTEGADANGALIGERWRIGPDLILEVSCPRIPCGTFQGWLAQGGWIKRFTLAAMPGPYFRVIEPGEIQAGDQIEIVHRPDHDITIALSFRALTIEPELLPRLLVAAALPEELKDLARRRTA